MHRLILFMQDNWGWVLSVAGVLCSALGYILTHIRALQSGVQALLRAQMIDLYNHYKAKGYAPFYARQSFENLWVQYEHLGKNGVMTDIRAKFLALPTHEEPN